MPPAASTRVTTETDASTIAICNRAHHDLVLVVAVEGVVAHLSLGLGPFGSCFIPSPLPGSSRNRASLSRAALIRARRPRPRVRRQALRQHRASAARTVARTFLAWKKPQSSLSAM